MHAAINKPVRVMAVDPGMSGAVVVAGCGDIDVRRDFTGHRAIADAVTDLLALRKPEHIVVELVGARPGQGVCSMFSFGESTGVGLGAVYAAKRQAERVAPLKWKNWYRKALGIEKGKEVDAREIALRLFPQYECYLKRKKDHNTADALLMALWKLNHL